uniref:restriction endonuclease subunit S n=1 Tax=uncultured Dysgonomonas sp. TaxID=206096 RepID=UPI002630A1E9|nr:restriction endonuclease subunit S [uncultured Dysgonomonas sp.]
MEGWQSYIFSEVAPFTKGISYKSDDYGEETDNVFITLKCVQKNGGFSFEGIKYYKGLVPTDSNLCEGDLLFANTDLTRDGDIVGCPIFLPNIETQKAITLSMDLSKLMVKQDFVDKKFLYYLMMTHSIRQFMKGNAHGSTVLHLKTEKVKSLNIEIPESLKEQQKIASILSTLDKNIELTEQLIAKQKNIKTGLMHDLLSYGIDEKGQIRSPQSHSFVEKNGIVVPDEWECKPISEVINIINGGTPSTSNPLFWDGDIFWLSVDDFNKGKRFVYKAQKTITTLGLQKSSTNILKEGEIIISARGTVGVVAQIGANMTFNQSCYGISLKSEEIYSNDYIYYFLYFYFKESNVITAGSTFDTIKKSTFDEIFISFSKDKQEQVKIISLLTEQDQIISEQEIKLEKLKSIKKGLMEDLLTGKVRVNY